MPKVPQLGSNREGTGGPGSAAPQSMIFMTTLDCPLVRSVTTEVGESWETGLVRELEASLLKDVV